MITPRVFSGDPSYEGSWWMHELTYGAEKESIVTELETRLRGEVLPPYMDQNTLKNSLAAALDKRASAVLELQKLIAAEVKIIPLENGEPVVASETVGTLDSFDFSERTICIRRGKQLQEITYATLEDPELGGTPRVVPVVNLETSMEYKF